MSFELTQLNNTLKFTDRKQQASDQIRKTTPAIVGTLQRQRTTLLYWITWLQEHTWNTPLSQAPTAPFYEPSAALKLFWTGFFYERTHVPFNITMTRFIPGLDLDAFKEACRILLQQHEILRTIAVLDPENKTVQMQVLQAVDLDALFTIHDIRKAADKKELLTRYIDAAQNFIFPHVQPSLQFIILHYDDTRSFMIFNISHALFDGYSKVIFEKEFETLYAACTGHATAVLPTQVLQFKDFCNWERQYQQQPLATLFAAYWYRDSKTLYPSVNLSTGFRETPEAAISYRQSFSKKVKPYLVQPDAATIQAFYGIAAKADRTTSLSYRFAVTGAVFDAMNTLCRERSVSMFPVLVALFNIYLFKKTGTTDIVLGSNIALRDQLPLQYMPGFLVNTILIRTQVQGVYDFSTVLTDAIISTAVASSFKYYTMAKILNDLDLPFERINTLFLNTYPATSSAILTDFSSRHSDESILGYFDIDLHIRPYVNGMEFRCNYDKSIYTPAEISSIFTTWMRLAESCMLTPDVPINDLKMDAAWSA